MAKRALIVAITDHAGGVLHRLLTAVEQSQPAGSHLAAMSAQPLTR